MNEKDEICKKLRATALEFDRDEFNMNTVVIITSLDDEFIGGHRCIFAPTMGEARLGFCSHRVSRFFEDVYAGDE